MARINWSSYGLTPLAGRRFKTESGSVISRRQAQKILGRESFEAIAKKNASENRSRHLARPARGRKSAMKLKGAARKLEIARRKKILAKSTKKKGNAGNTCDFYYRGGVTRFAAHVDGPDDVGPEGERLSKLISSLIRRVRRCSYAKAWILTEMIRTLSDEGETLERFYSPIERQGMFHLPSPDFISGLLLFMEKNGSDSRQWITYEIQIRFLSIKRGS